jgi:hypothetical protein
LRLFLLLVVLCGTAGSLHAQTFRPSTESEPDPAAIAAEQAAIAAARRAEEKALGLVHPYSALVRSAVVPGWGQFKIRQPVQGSVFFLGTTGLLAGYLVTHRDFRDAYDNGYLPAVEAHGVDSPEAAGLYTSSNEKYKVSQAFLFAALGVWGFGLIDAYIDANIYNAERRAEQVIEQGHELRKIQVDWESAAPTLSVNFAF